MPKNLMPKYYQKKSSNAHRSQKSSKKESIPTCVRATHLVRRKCRSFWPLSHPTSCLNELNFSVIIHADRRFFNGAGKVFALDFVELMRVEASHWSWSLLLMSTFIIKSKNLCFYWLRNLSHKAHDNFSPRFSSK